MRRKPERRSLDAQFITYILGIRYRKCTSAGVDWLDKRTTLGRAMPFNSIARTAEFNMNIFDALNERGLVAQSTDPAAIQKLVGDGSTTIYCGFDPTAPSLHAGSLVPILTLARLQRAGHRVIAVCGGATAMVGDPSGKTSMRPMLAREDLERNVAGIRSQMERYLVLDGERGILVDNSQWLGGLNWLQALRTIGRHFSINRMLSYETYKVRLETGLSYLELSYQLLQAYDFLHLYQTEGCRIQIGGDDQWANIISGMDLVRRVEQESVEGWTLPLLTTASGAKMGKTESGALWLDAERTSPYDFYQYWINVDDRQVRDCFHFFSLMPTDEVATLCGPEGAPIQEQKRRLAWEITALVHGEDEAKRATEAARALFGGRGADMSSVPSSELYASRLAEGYALGDAFVDCGLTKSRGELRRLAQQGGVYVNGERVDRWDLVLGTEHVDDGAILLRAGKKRHHRLQIISGD